MIYKLTFLEQAKQEWDKLALDLRAQLKKKLAERIHNPNVPKDALRGMKNCYKIKLHAAGYRLVYRALDERLVVQVIVVAKRENDIVYKLAGKRLTIA